MVLTVGLYASISRHRFLGLYTDTPDERFVRHAQLLLKLATSLCLPGDLKFSKPHFDFAVNVTLFEHVAIYSPISAGLGYALSGGLTVASGDRWSAMGLTQCLQIQLGLRRAGWQISDNWYSRYH